MSDFISLKMKSLMSEKQQRLPPTIHIYILRRTKKQKKKLKKKTKR